MERLARHKPWVTSPDNSLEIVLRDRGRSAGNPITVVTTSTQRIVADLRALRVSDVDELGGRALRSVGRDGGGDGFDAGLDGLGVGVAAAGGLAATGWVDDGFRGGAWGCGLVAAGA